MVKKHLHKFDQKVTSSCSQAMPSGSTNAVAVALAEAQKSSHPEDGQVVVQPTDDCPPIFGAVCERNEANREKGKRKFEAEIAKRLFYIIASFLVILFSFVQTIRIINCVVPEYTSV